MGGYDGARVKVREVVDGYVQAVARFSDATREDDGGTSAKRRLFEALNWAHSADDVIAEVWRPAGQRLGLKWRERVEGAEILAGVRYVRNRVHHQWADGLAREEGFRFPMRFPLVFHSWIWRPVGELPSPDPKRKDEPGRIAYQQHLENERAEDTLLALAELFDRVMGFLDPPRARSRAVPDGRETDAAG